MSEESKQEFHKGEPVNFRMMAASEIEAKLKAMESGDALTCKTWPAAWNSIRKLRNKYSSGFEFIQDDLVLIITKK